MNVISTAIPDVVIFEPKVFGDERGFFLESFNKKVFEDCIGRSVDFVQDNHSRSSHGVLRGLHYQMKQPQGKLVRVTSGAVFDVAVDMRRSSSTLGQWVGVELSEANKRQLWIPEGFAHGFLVLSASADFLYKASNYYNPSSERSVRWNDLDVGVAWPSAVSAPTLSAKDASAPVFSNAELFD